MKRQTQPRISPIARYLKRRQEGERGYVLMFSAIVMIPLLAIAGMATDVGSWYSSGTKIQKAADAAALAGVVWLPDLSVATRVALDTARENGYDDDDPDISVHVSRLNESELRVEITDDENDVYFSAFFLDNVTITREAIAQYVLPVPLGSPKNYFGTGHLAPSPEGFWASVNGYCTAKEQGDPFATRYEGNWPSSGQQCPGSTLNGTYVGDDEPQYSYILDLPNNRPGPVVVHLYSPSVQSGGPGSETGTITTKFRLTSPDSTPFNDDDNPLTTCTGSGESNPRSYSPGTVDNDATIFSRSGWSAFCTIPTSARSGRYILGVNSLENESGSFGSNNYSVIASYNGSGAICDTRTDDECPALHGKEWISIRAESSLANAEFYLAEVAAEHAGKQMEITLFDPGENGQYISLKDPNGNFVEFDWRTQDGHYSGSNETQLDVSGCNSSMPQVGPDRGGNCKFNERYVVMTVDLPADYATTYSTYWWKIFYSFSSSVTDRTTWSVRILGDPVHLSH